MTMTTTSNGTVTQAAIWTVEWFKPIGRGEKFRRQAHALSRRLRIPWVRSTLWERDHPEGARFPTTSYGPMWTSMSALANFSFACTCHPNERYSRKGKRKKWRP